MHSKVTYEFARVEQLHSACKYLRYLTAKDDRLYIILHLVNTLYSNKRYATSTYIFAKYLQPVTFTYIYTQGNKSWRQRTPTLKNTRLGQAVQLLWSDRIENKGKILLRVTPVRRLLRRRNDKARAIMRSFGLQP